MVRDKNILWFQVPVVNPPAVAVADGVQNLEEDALGKRIIPNILFAVCDVVKEIAFRAVL